MAQLTLRLFGPFSLELSDAQRSQCIALPPRSATLLAMLALSGGLRVHRSLLLDSLWDDEARDGCGARLSTALWRLRRALSPFTHDHGELVINDAAGSLHLSEHPAFHVDAIAFQKLTAGALARPAAQLSAAEIAQLSEAVRLYQGDLLPGVHSEWAQRERERLRRRHIDALLWLMQSALAQGDLDEAIRRGRHVLDLDPMREDVLRQLMSAQLRCGQRAHALRQFEACRARLRSELAIVPMPETMALYRDVAAQALSVQESPVSAATTHGEACEALRRARQRLADAEQQLRQFEV